MTATDSTSAAAQPATVPALGPKAFRERMGEPAITVGIVGATGYAGGELVRLLLGHPNVRIAGLYGRNRDHVPVAESHPHLRESGLVIDQTIPRADAIFTALPHGVAAGMARDIVATGAALIDIGPDFRLHDPADYPRWYKFDHPAPELLAKAVYGLPELHRAEMRAAADEDVTVIGLAGCYPTATILALAPLARAGLIADLVVDAKSGVSGAGREAKADLLFSEINDSVKAYGVWNHRHTAEMEQELQEQGERGSFGSRDANPGVAAVEFLPHLIPMTRGILASCHVRPTRPVSQAEVQAIYDEAYRDEPFVFVSPEPPATKQVYGSNRARIWPSVDPRTGRVLVLSAIDNLVKGAAGQAVQALNVVFGLPETTGLEQYPVAP
jgi:N-acetyl-gamma-glutamyl-phosphate reductase